MIFTAVLVIIGYLINISHEAAIVSLADPSFNKPLRIGSECEIKNNVYNASHESTYVKLPPGTKIYFYTTENENVMIGPKLQSDDEITISVVNQGGDLRKHESPVEARDSFEEPAAYTALKSGVLVPRTSEKKIEYHNLMDQVERNKCVYQSLKPTYYIKSFKHILIPADVLYTKSKQDEIFKSKNLDEVNIRRNSGCDGPDSFVHDFKKFDFHPAVRSKGKTSLFSPNAIPSINLLHLHKLRNHYFGLKNNLSVMTNRNLSVVSDSAMYNDDVDDDNDRDVDIDDDDDDDGGGSGDVDEMSPDKTCTGEVTLFVLRNDGVLKRITADPYMPMGMHLSFSLMDNFMFLPKFLGTSDLMVSYITGENGNLIPHPENLHKITAERGSSVSFMLSKNGGLLPVKEVIHENKRIGYYFNGLLVHESTQFKETFSNSTSLLINDKRFEIFKNEAKSKGKSAHAFSLSDADPNAAVETRRKRHRLQKREAFFNGYERGGNGHCQGSVEPHPAMRQLPEYGSSGSRGQAFCVDRHGPAMEDAQYAEHGFPRASKLLTPHFDLNPKSGSGFRGAIYSQGSEMIDHREEPGTDVVACSWDNTPLRPRTDIFIFDEKGTRIRLIPEITDGNDVVIYKLTCKGNLVRYPPCKEPEFGFEINFQLLLDEFVLVPTVSTDKPCHMTYVLQENGDLIPCEDNCNTFRKAPGSLIYYMLGKNNILFPVQQVIDMEGHVSFFYQDFFLMKMKDSVDKPLHFSTKGSPLFAFYNGLSVISMSSKPRLNPRCGSNWKHLKPSDQTETCPKSMFLTGPKGELVKITPYKNKQGATVVYELDCNGILYRSPKDKKKCIILKSYILLKEGILLPSNDTNGYVYMMSKNGDLFPYLYPDGKIEAPLASSLKYVLCEKGILLPIKLEIIDNSICYLFRDVVVYKERVYCKSCLDRLSEQQIDELKKNKKSSCDLQAAETNNSNEKDMKLFLNKNGDYVFYERQNKILKRCPSETVPPYLKYTMGSFEVKPDGSLYQIRYQDPDENVINLMLEPNGDLLEDSRNINNARSQHYVLDAKGNLIAVECRKTKKHLSFFKGSTRVCKVPLSGDKYSGFGEVPEQPQPPMGNDPLQLMQDPIPMKDDGSAETRSLYIPIPLKSVSVSNPTDTCTDCTDPEHKKKCDMLKETLNQVAKGNSLPLALELELTDDIVEELKNWAAKCDKVLTRRDAKGDYVDRNFWNDFSTL